VNDALRRFPARPQSAASAVTAPALSALALDALPEHVAVLDERGTIVAVNRAWRAFADASGLALPDHGVGSSYLAECDRAAAAGVEEAARLGAGLREILRGGRPECHLEYPCHAPGGERWFLCRAAPMEGGDTRGAVVVHENVSDYKLAEIALRETEERFRQLAEHIREVLWIATSDFSRLVYLSPAYEEMGGFSREKLCDSPAALIEAVHPDDRRRVRRAIRAVRREEHTVEFRVVQPGGEVRWLRLQGSPLLDGGGRPFRIVGTAEDVTRRRQREDEQRFLAQAGRALVTSLDYEATLRRIARLAVPQIADWTALYAVGATGEVERLEIAHADPGHGALADAFRRVPLGPEHPVRRAIRERRPVMAEEVTDAFVAGISEDPGYAELIRALAPRSLMVVPLVAHGHVLGAINLITAQSGRRYTRRDLMMAEELAHLASLAMENARLHERTLAAVRARDDVLGVVSHDLRNPLHRHPPPGRRAPGPRPGAGDARGAGPHHPLGGGDGADDPRPAGRGRHRGRPAARGPGAPGRGGAGAGGGVDAGAAGAGARGRAGAGGGAAGGDAGDGGPRPRAPGVQQPGGECPQVHRRGRAGHRRRRGARRRGVLLGAGHGAGDPRRRPAAGVGAVLAGPGARSPPGPAWGWPSPAGIVEAHAGRIDVQSEPGAGSTFTIRLPESLSADW
jgi:PAS domain S-box-containing protein